MALLILRNYGFVQCRRHLKVNAELHCDWLWRNFAVVTGHQQRADSFVLHISQVYGQQLEYMSCDPGTGR